MSELASPEDGKVQPKQRTNEQIAYEASLAGRDGQYTPDFHNANLYDENQDRGGNVIDMSTGKPIDTSTSTLETEVAGGGFLYGELPPIPKEGKDDETDEWLAEHEAA